MEDIMSYISVLMREIENGERCAFTIFNCIDYLLRSGNVHRINHMLSSDIGLEKWQCFNHTNS